MTRRLFIAIFSVLIFSLTFSCKLQNAVAEPPEIISPDEAGMSAERLSKFEVLIKEAIEDQNMPGCVVLIGRSSGVAYHKAFGSRSLLPEQRPMELNTLFDLASLTKPLATATSIHLLEQQGLIDFDAPAQKYLPSFEGNNKENITIRQLLTHTSGLLPDNALSDFTSGKEIAFQKIDALSLRAQPGEKFIYSDVGFIVLGRIVEQVSGKSLQKFTQQNIYAPLLMKETSYNPAKELHARAVVTQKRDDHWMQGEVHDPRAYYMEGVAGHAGLFSTAEDLACYATAALKTYQGEQQPVFTLQMVKQMSERQEVPGGYRTLGWDSRSAYSSNRGDLFSETAFGHGGFTGTSFWIDPELDLYVVFLSNRVHPDGKGSVNRLAGRIGTIAAGSICCESH